jgi:peptidoglycan/xylan/chitin deacetylase (PgdA/CDA1 family)
MSGPQVMIGVDMETDVGSWSSSYEGLQRGTPRLLELLDRHGISCTFFFTGDGARRHPEAAAGVLAAGHEIGCHALFHETIGDPLFDIPGMVPILPEEVEHRLAVATEWIEDATGVRPRSFRAPRLFGSTLMVNALDRLGYVSDASYPMYYYRERLTPYHPSATDWTQEGELSILELPNFADLSMESHGKRRGPPHPRGRLFPLLPGPRADPLPVLLLPSMGVRPDATGRNSQR